MASKIVKKHEKYVGNEANFQITCARYLDSIGAIWFHCPNEARGTKSHYFKRAKMGVKSGVLDILIFNEKHGFNGLGIELKVGYNKPSETQNEWMDKLSKCNWTTMWTNSLDEFIEKVDWYFGLNKQ